MLDLVNLLIFLIFSLPLILGILMVLCKACYSKWVFGIEIGFIIAGLLGLGLLGEQKVVSSLSFMGEPITFSISTTPLLLYLGTLLALSALVWRHSRVDEALLPRYQFVLLNLSLSFGFIAFISGQFMIRFIALEIVGLLAALTVLSAFADSLSYKRFVFIFQLLRLGDLSILTSILLINQHAHTLDISQMIKAAIDLPVNVRTWILLGFLFALLIKLAVWPFGHWLQRIRETTVGVHFWISGFLMPSLGYYLLYRIIPILTSDILFQNFTLFLGLVLIILILLANILRLVKFDRFTQMSGIYGCFLLGAVAFGASQYLAYYILGLILYRLVLFLQAEAPSLMSKSVVTLMPIAINGFFIWVNFNHYPMAFMAGWVLLTGLTAYWDVRMTAQKFSKTREISPTRKFHTSNDISEGLILKSAQWLYQKLEIDIFSNGFSQLGDFFNRIAAWLNTNIEQGFERLWSWIGQKLMAISEVTFLTFEVDAAEKTGALVDDALSSLDIYEQNILKRSLRLDLVWIPLLLVVILAFLFVV
jgi:hypothetical protein